MVNIIGLNGQQQSTTEEITHSQTGLPGVGKGFTALRDKDTGEIFVPSVYYDLVDENTVMYWDSKKNEIFNVGTWTINKNLKNEVKNSMQTRFRQKLDSYELIAFNMKDGKGLPYIYGHGAGTYNSGPCPLNRTSVNDINEIMILCKTFGKASKAGLKGTNESIEMLEIKEV